MDARGPWFSQEEEIEEVDTAWYRTEPDYNPVYGVPFASAGPQDERAYEQRAGLVEMEVTERQQEAYQPTDVDVIEYARFLGIQVRTLENPNPSIPLPLGSGERDLHRSTSSSSKRHAVEWALSVTQRARGRG